MYLAGNQVPFSVSLKLKNAGIASESSRMGYTAASLKSVADKSKSQLAKKTLSVLCLCSQHIHNWHLAVGPMDDEAHAN